MAEPKQKEVLILVDDYSTGNLLKCGSIEKLDTPIATDLIERGIADDNAKAIATRKKAAAEANLEKQAIEE